MKKIGFVKYCVKPILLVNNNEIKVPLRESDYLTAGKMEMKVDSIYDNLPKYIHLN